MTLSRGNGRVDPPAPVRSMNAALLPRAAHAFRTVTTVS